MGKNRNALSITDFKATIVKLSAEYERCKANAAAKQTEQKPTTPVKNKPISSLTEKEYESLWEGYEHNDGWHD